MLISVALDQRPHSCSPKPAPAKQVDVINRGYFGYNTRWAKHLLQTVFPADQARVTLVTLFWGANDAALPDRHRCALTDIYAFFGTFEFGASIHAPHTRTAPTVPIELDNENSSDHTYLKP